MDFNIQNYLRIDFQDVLFVLISTCIILILAKKFFWDKVLAFVKARQDYVQGNIDDSVQLKAQAMAMKDEYQAKLNQAHDEAHSIMENAKKMAVAQQKEMIEQAKNQANAIARKAEEDLAREKRLAESQMKQAIGQTAVQVAKKLVKKEMDAQTEQAYLDEFMEEAEKATW